MLDGNFDLHKFLLGPSVCEFNSSLYKERAAKLETMEKADYQLAQTKIK